MKIRWIVLTALLTIALPKLAKAQAFFTPGATSFSPQIDVLSTGVKSDVQATVSADRKYVTLNMREQNSALLNLYQFTINPQAANGPAGFVGNVKFPQAGAVVGAFGAVNAPVVLAAGNGEKILTQRGMTPVRTR